MESCGLKQEQLREYNMELRRRVSDIARLLWEWKGGTVRYHSPMKRMSVDLLL